MPNPESPQRYPYVIDVEPGKFAWCACGKSRKQPYCDGSHKDTGIKPIVVEINESKTVAWCGCKYSKNKPYCDGSHKNIQK